MAGRYHDRPEWINAMNSWAKVRIGGPWHQAEHTSTNNQVRLLCDGSTYYVDTLMGLQEYRFTPAVKCKKKACQREVEA